MPEVAQRILVIQDASRDVSPGAIIVAQQGFSLRPGDVVTILGVLHHVTNPMGYKIKVDKTNSKIIQEELDRKQEEYLKNEEIKEISEHYKTEKEACHDGLVTTIEEVLFGFPSRTMS